MIMCSVVQSFPFKTPLRDGAVTYLASKHRNLAVSGALLAWSAHKKDAAEEMPHLVQRKEIVESAGQPKKLMTAVAKMRLANRLGDSGSGAFSLVRAAQSASPASSGVSAPAAAGLGGAMVTALKKGISQGTGTVSSPAVVPPPTTPAVTSLSQKGFISPLNRLAGGGNNLVTPSSKRNDHNALRNLSSIKKRTYRRPPIKTIMLFMLASILVLPQVFQEIIVDEFIGVFGGFVTIAFVEVVKFLNRIAQAMGAHIVVTLTISGGLFLFVALSISLWLHQRIIKARTERAEAERASLGEQFDSVAKYERGEMWWWQRFRIRPVQPVVAVSVMTDDTHSKRAPPKLPPRNKASPQARAPQAASFDPIAHAPPPRKEASASTPKESDSRSPMGAGNAIAHTHSHQMWSSVSRRSNNPGL